MSTLASEGIVHAFRWVDGTMTDLGTLAGVRSIAYGVNSSGQIVGISTTAPGDSHAVLWQDDEIVDPGTLGGPSSIAFDISASGLVAGASDTESGTRVPVVGRIR